MTPTPEQARQSTSTTGGKHTVFEARRISYSNTQMIKFRDQESVKNTRR